MQAGEFPYAVYKVLLKTETDRGVRKFQPNFRLNFL